MAYELNFMDDLTDPEPRTVEFSVSLTITEFPVEKPLVPTHKIVCRICAQTDVLRSYESDTFDPANPPDPVKQFVFPNVDPGIYNLRAELIDITNGNLDGFNQTTLNVV